MYGFSPRAEATEQSLTLMLWEGIPHQEGIAGDRPVEQ